MADRFGITGDFSISSDGTTKPTGTGGIVPGELPPRQDDNPITLGNYTLYGSGAGNTFTQTPSGLLVPSNQAGETFFIYDPLTLYDRGLTGASQIHCFTPATDLTLQGTAVRYGIVHAFQDTANYWMTYVGWSANLTGESGVRSVLAAEGQVFSTVIVNGWGNFAIPNYHPPPLIPLWLTTMFPHAYVGLWQDDPRPFAARSLINEPWAWYNLEEWFQTGSTADGGSFSSFNAGSFLRGISPPFEKFGQGFYISNPRAGDKLLEFGTTPLF